MTSNRLVFFHLLRAHKLKRISSGETTKRKIKKDHFEGEEHIYFISLHENSFDL